MLGLRAWVSDFRVQIFGFFGGSRVVVLQGAWSECRAPRKEAVSRNKTVLKRRPTLNHENPESPQNPETLKAANPRTHVVTPKILSKVEGC